MARRVVPFGSLSQKAGIALACGAALLAAGCQNLKDEVETPRPIAYPAVRNIEAASTVGVKATVGPPDLVTRLVLARAATPALKSPRSDPFHLHPIEAMYDVKQANMRVVEQLSGGSFGPVFNVEQETVQVQEVEPQPYRRLAGVLVGESVMAIIDMGDGRPTQIIRPGQQIPNSPWRVVSIDEQKAVLRRRGNRLPKEIVVRLENPPAFPNPGAGAGPPAPTGDQPAPGTPPPGPPPREGRGDAGGIE